MNTLLDNFLRFLRFKKISKYLPENPVVCDLGCGRDYYLLKKISVFIKQGIGLDSQIDNRQDSNIELIKIEIKKNIPLESGRFDIVVMSALIEHLSYPEEILKEAFRILKKEGNLILTTPTPLAKKILEFMAYQLKLIDAEAIQEHKNYFWPEEIRKMLIKSGFNKENIKSNFFEFFLNTLIIVKK